MPLKPPPPPMPPPVDEDYREAARRKPDRVTFPGIPTGKLRPPASAPLHEPTPTSTRFEPEPAHPVRQRQPTLAGGAGVPARGAAPAPEPVNLKPPVAPPRSVSPIPWDPAADEAERISVRRGDRVVRPSPESTSVPPASELQGATHVPWWRTTRGMVTVIGCLTAAIPATSAATTTAVVSIINALKQPTDPKIVDDVKHTREEIQALRDYLSARDVAKQKEIDARFDREDSRIIDIDLRCPAAKVDPRRAPKGN